MSDVTQIIGTALTVGVAGAGLGIFVLRAVIAKDVRPMADTLLTLDGSMEALAHAFTEMKEEKALERGEIREILKDLNSLVRDLEGRVAALEGPRPPAQSSAIGRRRRLG